MVHIISRIKASPNACMTWSSLHWRLGLLVVSQLGSLSPTARHQGGKQDISDGMRTFFVPTSQNWLSGIFLYVTFILK